MEGIYSNVDHSNQKCSHCRGNQVSSSKRTKVLLIVLSVSLVLALGGLCVLGIMYAGKVNLCDALTDRKLSKLQSDPENYGHEELLHKYKKVTKCFSSCTEFIDPACKLCANGWIAHRGKCYFFSSKKQTWFESRDSCVASGAHLVIINNKKVQDFLVSKVNETHWIGLNDLDTEGHWVWVNNQTLSETGVQFWHTRKSEPNEPDNWKQVDPSGENCASMGNRAGTVKKWFDNSCKEQKKFICEIKYAFPLTDDN
uniref:Immune-related lectin-like receptor 6 n=1 Tax=Ctenopharyngodon idella TaxID=7959 RepID=A0A8A5LF09_CTEID|nr:immune-related lectin-like receptor 6 [Ctenopharyngodon idella]